MKKLLALVGSDLFVTAPWYNLSIKPVFAEIKDTTPEQLKKAQDFLSLYLGKRLHVNIEGFIILDSAEGLEERSAVVEIGSSAALMQVNRIENSIIRGAEISPLSIELVHLHFPNGSIKYLGLERGRLYIACNKGGHNLVREEKIFQGQYDKQTTAFHDARSRSIKKRN